MFRLFFTPGQMHCVYKDNDKSLAGYITRAGGVDCYHTLNVYVDMDVEKRNLSFYDIGFDFDCKDDVKRSAADAVKVCDWLTLNGIGHRIYFSGSKGWHVVVPHQLSGMKPRDDGGQLCKLFQLVLVKKLKLPTLDTNIHGVKRMWRCVNTINSKSGLYKIEIALDVLKRVVTDGPDEVLALAATPQPTSEMDLSSINTKLYGFMQKILPQADETNTKNKIAQEERAKITVTKTPACLEQILRSPKEVINQAKKWKNREVPTRNTLTVIATSLMKCHMGMSQEDILTKAFTPAWRTRVAEISSSDDRSIERSTQTAVRAVFERNYIFACGMAVKHGCICSNSCPLYREKEDKVK